MTKRFAGRYRVPLAAAMLTCLFLGVARVPPLGW